jgi:hypothetical protein
MKYTQIQRQTGHSAGFLLVDDRSHDSGREELRELACWKRTDARNRLEAAPLVLDHRKMAGDEQARRRAAVHGAAATQSTRERLKGTGKKPCSPGTRRAAQKRRGRLGGDDIDDGLRRTKLGETGTAAN